MAVIYTVKRRCKAVVTMVSEKDDKKEIEIKIESNRTGGIRAGYQMIFKDDVVSVENMSFRRNEHQEWKPYSAVKQSAAEKRRVMMGGRGQRKSGLTPPRFQFY